MKYIFVTGGVVSGLGKGITAASLGMLLKSSGLTVSAQKLDPYFNVDPGTMSPYEHGEVFVTEDGAETDLDLGHYERFIDENLSKYSNLTSGKAYFEVLSKERQGGYLGQTVQMIPHITEKIKAYVYANAKKSGAEINLVEIGGTIGDLESQPFLEAIRQISLEVGRENCLFIHVTLVPYIKSSGEHKSKPTQHSAKELRSLGIVPNIIVTRADEPISQGIKDKIALFCNISTDCVVENMTLDSLYKAPLMLHENKLHEIVCRELKLDVPKPDLEKWNALVEKIDAPKETCTIAIVGKYVQLHDAYLSVVESIRHAGINQLIDVNIEWIDSEDITSANAAEIFKNVDGMIIPGGFGNRGVEGKISACKYARENNIPFLGICLGMQIVVIEFARSVCGLADANSSEFDEITKNAVINIMEDQQNLENKGGTMRLGAYPCTIKSGTLAHELYGSTEISERHRHRYEFNNTFKDIVAEKGMVISGTSPDGTLVEMVEIPENDYFIAAQFHPEFKSRPTNPHPLFVGLIKNSKK